MSTGFLEPTLDAVSASARQLHPFLVLRPSGSRERVFDVRSHPGCSLSFGVARRQENPTRPPLKRWFASLKGPAALIGPVTGEAPHEGSVERILAGDIREVRVWTRLQAIDAERSPDAVVGRLRESIGWLIGHLVEPADETAIESRRQMSDDGTPLWCEPGRHAWTRPPWRGRPPRACPDHSTRLDAPHPSTDGTCFFTEDGWSVRYRISPRLRQSSFMDVPEALAPLIGLGHDDVRRIVAASGDGPTLTLRRGRRLTRLHGPVRELIPPSARDGDLLFVALGPADYRVTHFRTSEDDPFASVAALVGLSEAPVTTNLFWARVARGLGLSPAPPRDLAAGASARGDQELAEAIELASRVARGTGAWTPDWDITAGLHSDPRYLAVASKHAYRVAVGIADPRDRLPTEFIVTNGGLVWVEVERPEQAREYRVRLAPDVVAPTQNDRWVRWMRAEHQARQVSLAGVPWRLWAEPDGWRLDGGEHVSDLTGALEAIGESTVTGRAIAGLHVRHTVPRSVLAVDRAVRAALQVSLVALESETDAGFAAVGRSDRQRSSSILGALLPETT